MSENTNNVNAGSGTMQMTGDGHVHEKRSLLTGIQVMEDQPFVTVSSGYQADFSRKVSGYLNKGYKIVGNIEHEFWDGFICHMQKPTTGDKS